VSASPVSREKQWAKKGKSNIMVTIQQRIGKLIVGVLACCLSSFTPHAFAIEGLEIAVPSTNVMLSWPSDSSETYIIQYRHTLNSTNSWMTLADYYPADGSTNITSFTDTNLADFGSGTLIGGTNGGGSPMPGGGGGGGGGGTNTLVPGQGFYRVVRDGAHLVGITNDMILSGIVKIPVELGNSSGDVSVLNISENGTPVGNSIQTAPITPTITLDTTLMANGTHNIYGTARWDDTNGGLWEADSPTIFITTSNEITFENWMPAYGEIGDTLLFRATSAHPVTDWIVSVYDNTNGYLGYFSGHTDNGDISFYWDYSGTVFTNVPSFSFELQTEYIDPPAPPTYKQKDPWISPGGWVFGVQHAFDDLQDVDLLYSELDGFFNAAKSSFPVAPSTSAPYPISFQDSTESNNWAAFKFYLFNPVTRNLCYFGHGGPNGIGYNQHDPNLCVTASQIASVLHTIPAGQTNRHVFRFVFLDGCSTAKGTLPEAFGILHKENVDVMDYYYASMRPSAFCGWTATKYVGFILGHSINYDHVNFISHIQEDMLLNGASIGDAIRYAAGKPDVTSVFTSEFKLFGCSDVTIGSNNN
jgi:hypothetical protein